MSLLNQVMRLPFAKGLWAKLQVGSVRARVDYGIFPYSHYAFGLYWGAVQASLLGLSAMTAIEFGVAGGRGLIAMERASAEIGTALGVDIDVVGFDSGTGLPQAIDYRDLPHIWSPGFYAMDVHKLQSRLTNASLILGDVRESVPQWLDRSNHAPIGFIAFDLDYYTSTKAAMKVFAGDESNHLPRVYCYFDDVAANELGCMNPYVGELLAINEFNAENEHKTICKIEQLRLARNYWEKWQDRMYAFHNFQHSKYTQTLISPNADTQLNI
jgi:hypothetical protein